MADFSPCPAQHCWDPSTLWWASPVYFCLLLSFLVQNPLHLFIQSADQDCSCTLFGVTDTTAREDSGTQPSMGRHCHFFSTGTYAGYWWVKAEVPVSVFWELTVVHGGVLSHFPQAVCKCWVRLHWSLLPSPECAHPEGWQLPMPGGLGASPMPHDPERLAVCSRRGSTLLVQCVFSVVGVQLSAFRSL